MPDMGDGIPGRAPTLHPCPPLPAPSALLPPTLAPTSSPHLAHAFPHWDVCFDV